MGLSVNEQLLSQLDNPGAKTKLSAKFSGYIRDRLRELSYAENIIPVDNVDRSQCQVSVNHDALVKIEYLEPKSKAAVVNFRGEPTARFIRGEKVEVPFISIMTEKYQKPEQEFLAYPFPIAKVIEDNAVKDLEEVVDREFTIHIEAGVQALQLEANGGVATALNATGVIGGTVAEFSATKGELARIATTDDGTVYPLQRPDIVRLIKLLDGNRLESETLLMTTVDWNDILAWTVEDNGSPMQSETVVNGYKHNLLLGKKCVRSIKTDVLRPGNVYVFTKPEFLGRHYLLNAVKFYIDKIINLLTFVAWKDIGMSIINIASVRKLELYSGDANPGTDADSILAAKTPVSEEDLGAENNRAGARLFFPQVVQF